MTTFSQLVDEVSTELLRPDMRTAIAAYVNQTVRELHFRPNGAAPILYDANRYEDDLAITTDQTWLWTIPSVTRFQDVEAIYLDDVGRYVPKKNPRISLEPSFQPFADLYYYRGGNTIAVAGVANGWTGKISYFLFPQTLVYQAASARVVSYDAESDSYKLADNSAPSDAQLNAATNWMLQRWDTVIRESVRSKTWKRLGDSDRARMSFSSYEAMRLGLWQSEPAS